MTGDFRERAVFRAKGNLYEDFEVGAVYKHYRGKTITPLENVLICNMVMNCATGHFDEHQNALEELGLDLDSVRLSTMVHHGDTLYA